MQTRHTVYFSAAQNMGKIKENSIDLVVTSPPYPMIEMWDDIMASQNSSIKDALDSNDGNTAFELMHKELDRVLDECYRVLKNGGFLCINIGDATRTINSNFCLFSSHSRIIKHCLDIGLVNLPNIIWRKQTNAPNKFMGSGMLPCGAYVTLEHEYILVFRKGEKRSYKTQAEKTMRKKSSFFWEERNVWFSDLWDLKGTKQKIANSPTRERSAAFPLEVPYRLINMYSQIGDTVLDPFMGLGTTMQAAMILGRNSVGFEIDCALKDAIESSILQMKISDINNLITERFRKHEAFVTERTTTKGPLKHFNNYLGCEVMTGQEEELELHYLTDLYKNSGSAFSFSCEYEEISKMGCSPKVDGSLF